jgi:hypothetical protein
MGKPIWSYFVRWRPHWVVIVGSATAHGRLELRTDQKDAIWKVDAAENKLTELQHYTTLAHPIESAR